MIEDMKNPEVLGRQTDEKNENATSRAKTIPGPELTIPYTSGSMGSVCVQTFFSIDDEDRGGLVLRLSVEDEGSSFIPAARSTPEGVEIHMAGDAEAASLIRALRGVLAAMPEPRRYQGDAI